MAALKKKWHSSIPAVTWLPFATFLVQVPISKVNGEVSKEGYNYTGKLFLLLFLPVVALPHPCTACIGPPEATPPPPMAPLNHYGTPLLLAWDSHAILRLKLGLPGLLLLSDAITWNCTLLIDSNSSPNYHHNSRIIKSIDNPCLMMVISTRISIVNQCGHRSHRSLSIAQFLQSPVIIIKQSPCRSLSENFMWSWHLTSCQPCQWLCS